MSEKARLTALLNVGRWIFQRPLSSLGKGSSADLDQPACFA
jgi:hypothetical protein